MRLNKTAKATPVYTHGGALAYPHLSPIQAFRRSVLACLLWEDTFYEDGQCIADRIANLALSVSPDELGSLAIEARHQYHLRHVPLVLLNALTKTGREIPGLVQNTVSSVISRPDELAEMLAIYWADGGRRGLSAQLKKGLARAFSKFSEYQLAKYNRPNAIKLRDVMRLSHPKPASPDQEKRYAGLIAGTLATPDTWEVALSAGEDKREAFTRLLTEGKLGYMALLKNLRLMDSVGVSAPLIEGAILARRGAHNIIPFRYISAARAAPRFERSLDTALIAAIKDLPPFSGRTVVVCDCSGSMDSRVSAKSEVSRLDAAAALAGCINGDVRMIAYSDWAKEVPARPGLACADVLKHAGSHGGTDTHRAVLLANQLGYDRIILITDEQSATLLPDPLSKLAYCINVASYQNGIGYGKWTHIDGFSEAVIRYMHEVEKLNAQQ